eukprot:5529381-Pleurochrysis_carterae.AAC.1
MQISRNPLPSNWHACAHLHARPWAASNPRSGSVGSLPAERSPFAECVCFLLSQALRILREMAEAGVAPNE